MSGFGTIGVLHVGWLATQIGADTAVLAIAVTGFVLTAATVLASRRYLRSIPRSRGGFGDRVTISISTADKVITVNPHYIVGFLLYFHGTVNSQFSSKNGTYNTSRIYLKF